VGAFFLGANSMAWAAESWVTDPKTGCKVAWVSLKYSLVSASWSGSCVDNKAEGKGMLTFTVRDKDGKEEQRQAEGEMKAGKLNGKSILKFPDGAVYEGDWKNGSRDGNGVFKFPDGRVYEGDWKNDTLDGKGIYKWPDGRVYEGDWKNNTLDGKGIYKFHDGAVYEGDFKNGRRDGKGIYKWPDGRVYEGDWKNDKFDGNGVLKDSSGKVIYQGLWEDGKQAPFKAELKEFEAVARKYREAKIKPSPPEEARKFLVQAEFAFDQQRLADAAKLYTKASILCPWWPQAHYNRAMVLSILKESDNSNYQAAILGMKKYLMLVPDAPNARAAQDNIYKWEGMIK
jgi:hypothetical protein